MRVLSIITLILIASSLLARADEEAKAVSLVRAARAQIGKTVRYDPSYRALGYPNGDVPIEGGVCTDVVRVGS